MRKLYLIGIGAGNPEYVTVQAIKALNKVDVFFFMDKGEAKQDLVMLRRDICERYIENRSYRIVEAADPIRDPEIEDYKERVDRWHQQRALLYEDMIAGALDESQCGAFLVWGDPSLYDSTLRIIEQITARNRVPIEYEVIPGISSMQALAARHRISLNGVGESIQITTGRRLRSRTATLEEKTLVMLDGQSSFQEMLDEDLDIFWAAYLGMDKEILVSGKLCDVAGKIQHIRAENRQRNGWIMDTYLLCKASPADHSEAAINRSSDGAQS
jgi:precorrin-6A synthase